MRYRRRWTSTGRRRRFAISTRCVLRAEREWQRNIDDHRSDRGHTDRRIATASTHRPRATVGDITTSLRRRGRSARRVPIGMLLVSANSTVDGAPTSRCDPRARPTQRQRRPFGQAPKRTNPGASGLRAFAPGETRDGRTGCRPREGLGGGGIAWSSGIRRPHQRDGASIGVARGRGPARLVRRRAGAARRLADRAGARHRRRARQQRRRQEHAAADDLRRRSPCRAAWSTRAPCASTARR